MVHPSAARAGAAADAAAASRCAVHKIPRSSCRQEQRCSSQDPISAQQNHHDRTPFPVLRYAAARRDSLVSYCTDIGRKRKPRCFLFSARCVIHWHGRHAALPDELVRRRNTLCRPKERQQRHRPAPYPRPPATATAARLPGSCARAGLSLCSPCSATIPPRYNQQGGPAAGHAVPRTGSALPPGAEDPLPRGQHGPLRADGAGLRHRRAGAVSHHPSPTIRRRWRCTGTISALGREGRAKYEETHGPLLQTDHHRGRLSRWLDNPWPWDEGGND